MAEIFGLLKSLWLVWLLVLFVGIVVWVMRPSRTAAMRHAARIPLDEDEAAPPRRRRGF